MSLNSRQRAHINRVQSTAQAMSELYGLCFQLKKAHDEEFSIGQNNEILSEDLEKEYSISTSKLNAAISQCFQAYINLWTNQSVNTREYGKDARAVSAQLPVRFPV